MKIILSKLKNTIFISLCVLATLLLASCSTYKGDTLRVGIVPDHSPWEIKGPDNMPTGISVDFMEQFSNAENYNVEWIWLERDELLNALRNHDIDMFISSTTIMEDRLDEFLISDPYAKVYDILLISKSSKLIGKNELNNDHINIAVIANSETENLVKSSYSSASITSYKNRQSAAAAVANGTVDAFADDPLSVMTLYAQNESAYRINPAPLSDEFQYYVAYFNQDHKKLRDQFNDFLFNIKKEGFYDTLNDKFKLPLQKIMDTYQVEFIL